LHQAFRTVHVIENINFNALTLTRVIITTITIHMLQASHQPSLLFPFQYEYKSHHHPMTFQKEHQRQRPHHPDQSYPLYQDEKQQQEEKNDA